jgi:hypothetical protein
MALCGNGSRERQEHVILARLSLRRSACNSVRPRLGARSRRRAAAARFTGRARRAFAGCRRPSWRSTWTGFSSGYKRSSRRLEVRSPTLTRDRLQVGPRCHRKSDCRRRAQGQRWHRRPHRTDPVGTPHRANQPHGDPRNRPGAVQRNIGRKALPVSGKTVFVFASGFM